MSTRQGLKFLAGQNTAATIVESLGLRQYHEICYLEFSVTRSISISTSATANIGSVVTCASEDLFEDIVEVASLPKALTYMEHPWYMISLSANSFTGEVMEDGWTRFQGHDIFSTYYAEISLKFSSLENIHAIWLGQANHIFSTLQISSNLQDHGAATISPNTITAETLD
ncbi:hypothetical protein MSAN_00297500 [Mycena sanguinolenta]|uniref:Uncharacterized protein n=1 Tax=Mycena sanguinolenta TaxID=230812 RepID=A0A8H7DJ42_9AGAR|nr:hypothetical protein MSAN_00297500 [Mycena sanguinolenta]